ncbi:hypothetical protein EB118_00810 [bacterium]|nr:hypothetical protein [bacterium]NBX98401.1 hypothetical protein [bacterium]NDC93695.1 hypothetical protein [bacterium]NDD84645.1 hypothetical protein [bacterium]NDG28631.1 hypothetical protein [bacterium]
MNDHPVEAWKTEELAHQQQRIENLGRGFAHLHLLRQERQNSSCPELSISDVVLAANIAHGPDIASVTILDFAKTAYDAGFLAKTDSLGQPEFRTRLIAGVTGLEQLGLLTKPPGFALYTHVDYQPQ